MGIEDAYAENHIDFEIDQISYEDDAVSGANEIDFEYTAPEVSVDSAGRFAVHEIIGGATVRQKIGEEPVEVSVSGVCKESVAKKLDGLRDAKFGTIYSNRLVGESMVVQFASISTSPLESSGAVAIDSEEFLYTFDLSCVEVVV